jgi:hypothetical protein
LRDLHELDIEDTFTKISAELHLFVIDGIDKYLEIGKLKVTDLKNTSEARRFLELVNDKRKKEERKLINLNE